MHLLYDDVNKMPWDEMPFPKKWFGDVLADKVNEPRGYLKIQARDESKGGKVVYEEGGENQVMYWLKRSFAMLEGGIFYSSAGEHKGYQDNTATQQNESNMPAGWDWGINAGGNSVYSTHAWNATNDSMAISGTNPITSSDLFPFFPTKMRFGEGGPTDITTPIDPGDINLNDPNSVGPGNSAGKNNFIFIGRTNHIAFTTTGFSNTAPTGYFADYGSVFKNITVYQVSMPAGAAGFVYDGKSLNEAGLYCDASLTGTRNGLHEMPSGMLLTKRYFNPIQKTNTISINFQWSIVK